MMLVKKHVAAEVTVESPSQSLQFPEFLVRSRRRGRRASRTVHRRCVCGFVPMIGRVAGLLLQPVSPIAAGSVLRRRFGVRGRHLAGDREQGDMDADQARRGRASRGASNEGARPKLSRQMKLISSLANPVVGTLSDPASLCRLGATTNEDSMARRTHKAAEHHENAAKAHRFRRGNITGKGDHAKGQGAREQRQTALADCKPA